MTSASPGESCSEWGLGYAAWQDPLTLPLSAGDDLVGDTHWNRTDICEWSDRDYPGEGCSQPCYWAESESQVNNGPLPHSVLINKASGFKFWAKHIKFMSRQAVQAAAYHDWLGKDSVRTDRGQEQAEELPWCGRGLWRRAACGGAGAAAQGPVNQGLLPLGVFLQWLWKKTQTFITCLSVLLLASEWSGVEAEFPAKQGLSALTCLLTALLMGMVRQHMAVKPLVHLSTISKTLNHHSSRNLAVSAV